MFIKLGFGRCLMNNIGKKTRNSNDKRTKNKKRRFGPVGVERHRLKFEEVRKTSVLKLLR